jgi:four helix bundle protein
MATFTNLEAWKTAMDLLEEIYRLTSTFPTEEKYALTSQMRRAAISIVGNIAEGSGRFTYADRASRFVIARGECSELEAYLYAAVKVVPITQKEIQLSQKLIEKTGKLLSGLINSCNRKKNPSHSNLPVH